MLSADVKSIVISIRVMQKTLKTVYLILFKGIYRTISPKYKLDAIYPISNTI